MCKHKESIYKTEWISGVCSYVKFKTLNGFYIKIELDILYYW